MEIKDIPSLDEFNFINLNDEILHIEDIVDKQKLNCERYPSGYRYFDEAMNGGFKDGDFVIISGISGQGKCHGKGTKILMFDGSIKNVEDVVVGDKLMGDDSTPRNVLSLARGREKLYKIKHFKDRTDPFIVNESHILSLMNASKAYGGKGIKNISVKEYLSKSDSFKRLHYCYKRGVNFEEKKLPLDPYILGVWLGDGTSVKFAITNSDKEILNKVYKFAKKKNFDIKIYNSNNTRANTYCLVRKKNGVSKDKRSVHGFEHGEAPINILRRVGVLGNKHIPDVYKINSRENRLKLLAGIVDTDGFLNCGNYEVVAKSKRLADDIVYLSRSLGFHSYHKIKHNKQYNLDYHRISIIGDCSLIPTLVKRRKASPRKQIKNPLHYSFVVEELDIDDYYGFEIDGNHLYLLGDFTVTHNTSFGQSLTYNLCDFGFPCLWFSYEVSIEALHLKFKEMGMKDFYHVYAPKQNTTGRLEWIKKKINEAKIKYSTKFIFIDHLDFLTPTDITNSDNQAIALKKIAIELKSLAIKLKVVIVAMAHLKKLPGDKEPDMQDIGYSAGIFQLPDYVILIYREKNTMYRSFNGDDYGETYTNNSIIKYAKNRETGKLPYIKCVLSGQRFVEVAAVYNGTEKLDYLRQ
jgi:replicative DNA helicase